MEVSNLVDVYRLHGVNSFLSFELSQLWISTAEKKLEARHTTNIEHTAQDDSNIMYDTFNNPTK